MIMSAENRSSLKAGSLQTCTVKGVPTHVYSRLSLYESSGSCLVLCVPGSPGMAQFYVPFVDSLYDKHNGKVDVCVLGHVGHSPGVKKKKKDGLGRDWYTLEDQADHKIAFIRQYYPNLESLYLIGHSVGCHTILQMQDRLPEVKKTILLFPTIERFSETPNAHAQVPYYSTFRWLAILLLWISTLFPMYIRKKILHFRFRQTPSAYRDCMVNATLSIDITSFYNILRMADQENKEIGDLPVDVISRHLDKLVFYYGVHDRWNLPCFFQEFTQRFPSADATLCPNGYEHAFVLKSSHQVASFCFKKMNIDG